MSKSRVQRFPIYLEPKHLLALLNALAAIVEGQDELEIFEYLEGLTADEKAKLEDTLRKLKFLKRVSELPPRGGGK